MTSYNNLIDYLIVIGIYIVVYYLACIEVIET